MTFLKFLKNRSIQNTESSYSQAAVNWQKVITFTVLWLIFGYVFFAHIINSGYFLKLERPVFHVLLRITIPVYIALLLAPMVVVLNNHFPFDKNKLYLVILVHLAGLIIFSLVYMNVIEYLFEHYIGNPLHGPGPGPGPRMRMGPGPGPGPFADIFMERFNHTRLFVNALQHLWQSVFFYALILGVTLSFTYYRKYRERELQAFQLEAQLLNAQLSTLKTQLQPHFLFNTLHTLSSLIYENVPAADKMIRQLSDLLRLTLESSGDQEIPLKRELEHLQLYLEIMQIRFQERLQVNYSIDEEANSAFIPTMLLQPLVENMIKEGLEAITGNGQIDSSVARVEENSEIIVRDNGPGFSGDSRQLYTKGVGLANTIDRLEKLFGSNQSVKITSGEQGGMTVFLQFPFHTAPWIKKA